MVALKIQTLFAFWALTYFSYLSHADDELHCPIPKDFSGKVDVSADGMVWMICKGSTYIFLLTCNTNEFLKKYYKGKGCKELRCPIPQDFPGKTHVTPEGKVEVKCKDNYLKFMFACSKNVHNPGNVPRCKDTCGELPAMDRVEPSESASNRSYAVGTDIKLRCKDGYQPEPGKTDIASCRLKGRVGSWVMPTIQCGRCPEPPKIDNGRYEFKNPNYPTSVTYHCNIGYDLEGNNEISCQENDTWTGGQNPATCLMIRCPSPPNLPNGFVSAPSLEWNANATYQCNEGFELVGPKIRQCLANKTWSKEETFCQVISCPPPPSLPNGSVSAVSLEWKAKATYKCNLGFFLNGPKIRECLANKSWSKEEIICQEFRCPIPQDFPGDIEMYAVGELRFHCRNSSHSAVIRCLDSGKWLSPAPNCKGCKLDAKFPDGKYNDTLPSDGIFPEFTYLKFECNSGYELKGEPVSVCQPVETWKPPIPECISGANSGSFLPPKFSIDNVVFLFVFCLLIFGL